jgi:hypothetical protein
MVSHGEAESTIGLELGKGSLVPLPAAPFNLVAVAGAAEMINRLHPRGKATSRM